MEVIQRAGPGYTPWGIPRGHSWQKLTPARNIPSSPTVFGSPSASFPVPCWALYKNKTKQNKTTLYVNSLISMKFMLDLK